MIVKLRDKHPGKWQDGVVVKLAQAICKSFSPEPFVTGFRPFETDETRGMFSPKEEPVQVIRNTGHNWEFTMSNCTSISREEINMLFAEGKLHLKRGSWELYLSLDFEEDIKAMDEPSPTEWRGVPELATDGMWWVPGLLGGGHGCFSSKQAAEAAWKKHQEKGCRRCGTHGIYVNSRGFCVQCSEETDQSP